MAQNYAKSIPLKINLPQNLTITPKNKLFIYIPYCNDITLSNGKNFRNGFWSIEKQKLNETNILLKTDKHFFQFLLVFKTKSEEEITSNIYYHNGTLHTAPFITADYTVIDSKTINLRIKCFPTISTTLFEITGLPEDSTLSTGSVDDSNIWQVENIKAKNIKITLPYEMDNKKLHLSINTYTMQYPQYKTTFNMVININHTPPMHQSKYKQITIPAESIIKKTHLPVYKYIPIVYNLPENCCINNATHIQNKWILPINTKDIIIKNFNQNLNNFEINLSYIIISQEDQLPEQNFYNKRIKCNFKNQTEQINNFSKCITCKNCSACKMFEKFMDYLGDSTILKHIIFK